MCKNNIDFEKIAKSQRPYCVWIRAHDAVNAPLISVWIDPHMEAFKDCTSDGGDGNAVVIAPNFGDEDEPGDSEVQDRTALLVGVN